MPIAVQNTGDTSVNKADSIECTYSAFWTKNKMVSESVLLVYSSSAYYCNKIIKIFGVVGEATIYYALYYNYFQLVL